MTDLNISKHAFGVDLVTFSHPAYWGVETDQEVVLLSQQEAKAFWTKMLDDIVETGVTGIELTFPPFDWRGASTAFGGVSEFKNELLQRGLHITSGFFASFERHPNITDSVVRHALLEEAEIYAQFLQQCDAHVLVAGCPLRQTFGEQPLQLFDFSKAQTIADFLNELGALLQRYGVKLALHTEVSTFFAMPRDVQLLMLLTDPYYVHMCPDSAHLLLAGGSPVEIAKQYLDRIAISHWKDAQGVFPIDTLIDQDIHAKHRPYFCEFGRGEVALTEWAHVLLGRVRNDWNILELDASESPVKSMQHALKEVAGFLNR